jgi:hypothetical protein
LAGAAPALGAPAPTFEGTMLPDSLDGGGGKGGPPAPGRGPGAVLPPLWFIINIVPLNFGAALFIENPHFVQV